MGLTSYAELAVRLVNSASNGGHQDMLSEPEAVRALFRVVNRYVGNLAPMPGVFF